MQASRVYVENRSGIIDGSQGTTIPNTDKAAPKEYEDHERLSGSPPCGANKRVQCLKVRFAD